ncbi:MAG: hypothetical protein KAW12_04385 [Candidatus Aminicenantes bacterium]|nr:hypothetical protein [Candidatus Aminicenantes bacterium]
MKQFIFAVFILFCIMSLGGEEEKTSEKSPPTETFPAFEYYGGNILTESLPYYRKFEIKGSTALTKGNADVVELIVWYKNKIKQTKYWFRPEGSKTKEFRIVVDRLENTGGKYKFIFRFFSNPLIKRDVFKRIMQAMVNDILDKIERNQTVYIDDYQTILNEHAKKELKTISLFSQNNIYKIVNIEKENIEKLKKIDSDKIPEYELTEEMKQKLFLAISKEEVKIRKGEEFQIELSKYKTANANEIEELIKKIENVIEKLKKDPKESAKNDKLRRKNLENLKAAIDDPTTIDPKGINDFYEKHWPKEIQDDEILSQILSSASGIYDINKKILENQKILEGLYGKNGEIYGWLSGEMVELLRDIFILSTAQSVDVDIDIEELGIDINKLRLSAYFGYGLGFFYVKRDANTKATDTETDMFAFLGVKIRPVKVDRSVSKPFPNLLSRFSFTLGTVFRSKVAIKGQEQLEAFAGMMPTFGINYDISRYFGIQSGIVLFRQPHINPLVKDDYGVKAAVFLGIAYDIDVFNTLIEILKPHE